MAAQMTTISVYGVPEGWEPPTKKQCHGTTYLEYSIPKSLEKKLTKIINRELREFHKKCKCESCRGRRKNKK